MASLRGSPSRGSVLCAHPASTKVNKGEAQMKKLIGFCMVSGLFPALFIGATAANAQPIAEQPEYEVGDKWTFQAIENPGGRDD